MDFPSPYAVPVALSMTSHDRAGHRRTDAAWLDEVWADDETRTMVVAGDRIALAGGSIDWLPPRKAPEGQRLFLGMVDGVPHFAVLADPSLADESWSGLFGVGRLAPAEAGLAVHAIALAQWHRNHRFCPACGSVLEVIDAGHVLRCTGCGKSHFPRTDPAVIMLVTSDADGVDRALLGRQAAWPPGRYSTLAGFVDPGESLESAVVREVMEETGVEVADVSYFGNQPWPFPASLMVGFYARAVTTEIAVDGIEIEDAKWFTREELIAHSHRGDAMLPRNFSISRALIEAWVGSPLGEGW